MNPAVGLSSHGPKPLYRAKVLASSGLIVRAAHELTSRWVASAMPGEVVNVWEEAANNRVRIDKGWISSVWQGKATIERVQEHTVYIPIVSKPDTEPEPEPEPVKPASSVLDIKPLWQRAYPNVYLGTSKTTIARYGCLLTCATMLINYQLPASYSVPEMNEIFKRVNGFVSGNLLRFASLWEAFPGRIWADKFIDCELIAAPLHEIDAVLALKRPVIVETRLNRVNEHWVLIIGKKAGKYVINDPYTGKQEMFEDVYGEPGRWIYTIVSYARR